MSIQQDINVVWLKRDLRTQDHAPLYEAEKDELPYLIVYLFEPNLINYPDTSERHLQFIYHSILSMNKDLSAYNRQVVVFYGNALEVFQFLRQKYRIKKVFSHQESGIQITWERDKALARLFKTNEIEWHEFQRDGIVRGIKNRKGWDKKWFSTIHAPLIENSYHKNTLELPDHPFRLSDDFKRQIVEYPAPFQPAGESNAWRYLHSFIQQRGFNYHRHISKPTESRLSCSRISPFLAWGNLSIRQAYQFVRNHPHYERHKRPFQGFLTRLKWHCHFMQKFEVECEYETLCINRGYESLKREHHSAFIQAWETGMTGFPLLDACMRCVQKTGWINFRMRAMVVSFLCHHLDQDWRAGIYHLARQFLDYEPGIHYPQFQMQAGTTGVNTIRMYNPVKQSQDHDPEGKYIKKWLPELADVPIVHIHEPWKMTEMEQIFCGVRIGKDYPNPIIDLTESGRKAREKIWGHRKNELVKQEKQRILNVHTVKRNRKKRT